MDFAGFGPGVGEMFVEEGGEGAAVLLVGVEDLGEEFVAGVEFLADVVGGEVAVFADEDDAVDGEFVGVEGEGLFDGGEDLEAVAGGEVGAHVAFVDLVDVEGDELAAGGVPLGVGGGAGHEAAEDDVGVGVEVVAGDDGGEAGAGFGLCGEEEVAAGEGHVTKISEKGRGVVG